MLKWFGSIHTIGLIFKKKKSTFFIRFLTWLKQAIKLHWKKIYIIIFLKELYIIIKKHINTTYLFSDNHTNLVSLKKITNIVWNKINNNTNKN